MMTNHEPPGITYDKFGRIVGYKLSNEVFIFISPIELESILKDYAEKKLKTAETLNNWVKGAESWDTLEE